MEGSRGSRVLRCPPPTKPRHSTRALEVNPPEELEIVMKAVYRKIR